jgi:hypothetical protein
MLRQSWNPREWFREGDRPEQSPLAPEETFMWVYRRTESGVWTVGYYSPDREWNPDSDHPTREAAADRVSYLNGRGAIGQDDALERIACRMAGQ